MKIPRTSMLIVLFIGGWVAAQQPVLDPSVSTTRAVEKKKLQATLKLPEPKQSKDKIGRIGKFGTRAWTTIVGWHPGESAFPDPKTTEAGLCLISVGNTPPRQTERFN
jgi:hypothetical protein